jgi:hypothetical protein
LGEGSISHHLRCRDRGGVVPKAVPKADKADAVGPKADATESSSTESGTRPSEQAAPGASESTTDALDAQAKLDEWLADARRKEYEAATAAALAAVDETTSTSIDHDDNEDKSTEWTHLETLKYTLDAHGVEIGSRSHSGDVTIDTKTTPRIVNHLSSSRRSVMQKRLRDAFVIEVSLFQELLWVGQDTVGWYGNNPMPTHCWLVRELDAREQFPEIMVEEITLIIMNGGVLTLNPNKDWAAECPDGIYLPIAVTAGIFTLPISRTQALRWLKSKDWGADAKVSVTAKIHVPGQSDVKKLKARELGTHSSHFCKREWKDAGYMSVQMAEQLANYAMAGLGDQAFLNEPILPVFRQGSASRTAQQLQLARLAKEDLLLYAPDMAPKDPRDYYTNVLPARKIMENPEICHDEGAKSIVKIAENLPVGDYRMKEWNDFHQTVRAIGGRPVIQTPDEPLRATNIGWCAELMDLVEAGANRLCDPDSIDEGSCGLKAKAARDVWFAFSKIVTSILRHYGAHIPERGNKHDTLAAEDPKQQSFGDLQ